MVEIISTQNSLGGTCTRYDWNNRDFRGPQWVNWVVFNPAWTVLIGPTVENTQVPHSPYMYVNHGPWSVQAMSCYVLPPRLRASKISVIVVWVGFRTPVWPQFCSFVPILQVYATMFGEPESLSLRNTQASFFEAQTAEPLVVMNNLTMCISICAALAAGEADINFSNPRGRMPLHVESPAWACQPPVPGAGRHCSHSVIQGFWML